VEVLGPKSSSFQRRVAINRTQRLTTCLTEQKLIVCPFLIQQSSPNELTVQAEPP
jgi:hypothetical protein